MTGRLAACVDFGSTYTKAALVDVDRGELVATADHPTTLDSDVLDGWERCLDELVAVEPGARDAEVIACSSAGGGLRIGVVGNEELVTAEAGRRVALSSGGRVVHVASGGLREGTLVDLEDSSPDVVLLVGGTDGGNQEVLLSSAQALQDRRWPGPVVVAGNASVRDRVGKLLAQGGTPFVLADNVVPRIGVLRPDSARAAIREMFLAHVIGGKHLSGRADFTAMVRGATPDVVLTGVELLARGLDAERPGIGDVAVVDVGGATTDVHSVVEVDAEESELSREVVASVPVTRTVEADLGMRWSARTTVEQGAVAGLLDRDQSLALEAAAQERQADPGFLPRNDDEVAAEVTIAATAIAVAVRRHAGRRQVTFGVDGRVLERDGTDLRDVALLVGSGGVLRHAPSEVGRGILTSVVGEPPGGWQVPRSPRVVVDKDYVLAPAGLLVRDHPQAAYHLLRRLF